MSPRTDPNVPASDRARWLSLVIVLMAAFIVVLDTTVLNVSIPTIIRELDSTLGAVEWVVTGYALTFATFLIIGGRLGDIYGHRKIFMIGVSLFGLGSLIASMATSVEMLIIGEAVIEGLGASLMLPATIAIMSGTFRGRERATAFAAWGAIAGVGAACGPLIGGFLTTHYSWRWSFRINVIVAPLALIGALLFVKKGLRAERKPRIDIPGAILIAISMFILVFALSEGGTYGWITPVKDFDIAGVSVWPATMSFSVITVLLLVAVALIATFVVVERRKERRNADPLFQVSQFRLRTYRFGLITVLILAMGQLGLSFTLPIFLQDAIHLTAAQNGLWQLPVGISVIIGAQIGGRAINRFGTTVVVRAGLFCYATGILCVLLTISLDVTWWKLLPGLVLYGGGVGTAGAQLTNIVMSEVPAKSSGVASGTNTTARQLGGALGVAIIGSLLSVQTIRHATDQIGSLPISGEARQLAESGVREFGAAFQPGTGMSARDAGLVQDAIEHSVTSGTRVALTFAAVMIFCGAVLSFLIPRTTHHEQTVSPTLEAMEPLEPMDVDPALLVDRPGTVAVH